MELTSWNSDAIYYRLWKFLTAGPRREKGKNITSHPETNRWLVLKANAEIIYYKYQNNKFIVFELKPVKYENSENNNLGRVWVVFYNVISWKDTGF